MTTQLDLFNFVTAMPERQKNPAAAGKGRPRVHQSNAEKTAAYRDRNVRLEAYVSPQTADTLASLAKDLDCKRNELVGSMLRFALTNRNWRVVGLYGGRK